MELYHWIGAGCALMLQTAGVTAYIHNKFSSKEDLSKTAENLEKVNDAKHEVVLEKLEHLHDCLHELKTLIQENRTWKS